MIRNRRNSIALIGGIAISGFLVLFSASAHADCPRWWVAGTYEIVQSNDTTAVFQLGFHGYSLKGSAQVKYRLGHSCLDEECGLGIPIDVVNATVDGVLDGNSIELTAYWDNGWVGYYSGTINDQGRMKGTGYERRSPDTVVSWYSKQFVKCQGQIGSPLTVEEPDTIKAQGRVKTGVPGPAMEICEAARKAIKRNSPAAPGLKQKCLEAGGGEATQEITE